MDEQAKFNAWWESKGTNSVILRAQAWSAWLARAEAEQQQPEEDSREFLAGPKGVEVINEDPDEWVEITDPMHMLRRDVDFTNTRHDTWEPICFWHGQFIGKLHEWGYTDCRFRCRRRDLPKVEQKKTTDDFGMYLESIIAKDPQLKAEVDAAEAELAAIDARLNEPQPQKTRVRLWIDPDCNIYAGLRSDRDLELHYDHETRQFYTEEQR